MGTKNYLCLLILCNIICQGIGTVLENNIKKSSVLHVRRKRLVDKTWFGNRPVSLRKVRYVVNILANNVPKCTGSILSPTVVLTAAHCVFPNHIIYNILSGSAKVNLGSRHFIRKTIFHPYYRWNISGHDLALLRISPAINFTASENRKITLFDGCVQRNAVGTVSGWGGTFEKKERVDFSQELRSITVPILSREKCQNAYSNITPISDHFICTFYRKKKKYCTYGDSGSPLVHKGYLLGVLAFGKSEEDSYFPDIFMNLLHSLYKDWINSHVPPPQEQCG